MDSFKGLGEQELEEAIRGEREVGEESSKPKVRTTEAVPSEREVEEHNVDGVGAHTASKGERSRTDTRTKS